MIKRISLGIATVAIAFSFSGCGAENADSPTDVGGTLDGNYEVGTVNVDGESLRCITMKRGIGETSWGGLWCFPPEKPTAP